MKTLNPSAILWRKSSRSGTSGGQCVEVANLRVTVAAGESDAIEGVQPSLGRRAG